MNILSKYDKVDLYFYAFLMFHVAVWTLTPNLVRTHLPMDSLEAANWGKTLLWGYDRNPYFNAWLVAALLKLSKGGDWIIYLASSSCVALCFWAVYRVAKRLLTPITAVISVLMLEGLQYYHIAAIELNDNVLELALWPLAISFFYTAIKDQKNWHWLLVGLFTGLALMSKYLSIAIVLPMLGFLLFNRETHGVLKNPWVYAALGIIFLIVTPHVLWLYDNHFMTLSYAQDRMGDFPWYYRFISITSFLAKLTVSFAGALVLLGLASKFQWRQKSVNISTFDQKFILWMALGPLITLLIVAFIQNTRITTMWGQPFLSWMGVLLLVYLGWQFELKDLKRFFAGLSSVTALIVLGYSFSLISAGKTSSANFPGRALANYVEQVWKQYSDEPLNYVAGDRFMSGSVGFYGESQPKAFYDWNIERNPWIDYEDVKEKGAIIVWRADKKEPKLQDHIDLIQEKMITLPDVNFFPNRSDDNIGVRIAVVPPE